MFGVFIDGRNLMDKFQDKIDTEMVETKQLWEKIKRIEKGEKVEDDAEEMPKFFSDLLNGTPFGNMEGK